MKKNKASNMTNIGIKRPQMQKCCDYSASILRKVTNMPNLRK